MMAVKPLNTKKLKFGIDAFLPGLITFGPLLMLMGLHYSLFSTTKRPDWFDYGVAVLGTFMLILGLAMLHAKQQRIERRLDEFERLRN